MTKIDVYSGFLGEGKTTLIKKLIKEAYAGEKVVLIENEFGEIGVDGGFLKDSGVNITEMNSGCICCSLVGDFAKALKQVEEQYAPDRIIIEPSGVGKLSDVIRAVERANVENSVLNAFCAVVDANKCKMYMKNFGEFFIDQVKNASCVVLSHTTGMSEEKLHACIEALKAVNPDANYVTAEWDKLDNGSGLITGVIVARRDVVEANPGAVDSFLQNYAASVEWVNANNADAAQLIAEYGIIEAAPVAEMALPYCNIVCITGSEMKDKLSGYLQVLADAEPSSVGGTLPGDDFYYGG